MVGEEKGPAFLAKIATPHIILRNERESGSLATGRRDGLIGIQGLGEIPMSKNARLLPIILLVTVGCGNGQQGPVKRSWGKMKGLEKIVGNMSDTSYSKTRTINSRLNALGKKVPMGNFDGSFVWAEYAATWCSVCATQTPETKKVEKEAQDQIVFLTIMTGKGTGYNDHATVETAKSWANRFKLDPKHVLAAELWFKTVPEHRFYSPQGHTLFVHVGYLSADQIRKVIAHYKADWETWSKTGE